jgi:hypothetical protein
MHGDRQTEHQLGTDLAVCLIFLVVSGVNRVTLLLVEPAASSRSSLTSKSEFFITTPTRT